MSTKTLVKERPILFSGEMVRAILEGRKTVTRGVIKHPIPEGIKGLETTGQGKWQFHHNACDHPDGGLLEIVNIKCPYGMKGDRLWVRETWAEFPCEDHYIYKASEGFELERTGTDLKGCWKPSIHMPRKAARITLEVTEVRVERLQDISEEQAIAEGVERVTNPFDPNPSYLWRCYGNCPDHATGHDKRSSATASFMSLWDSINGDRPSCNWDANPWVWVVEFKRVEGGAIAAG